MSNHEVEKKEYLERLKITGGGVKKILELVDSEIMDFSTREKINEINDKNSSYHEKLEKNQFDLAVVGLERSGKSTFINSFICDDLLPSDSKRCTYTSTQLEYGDNTAIVEFYTKEEFNKNFRKMLKEIEYGNSEKISFEIITKSEIERYFETLQIKKAEWSNIKHDIVEIIDKKDQILKHLNGNEKNFSGAQLKTDEFKDYITKPGQARAVKKITIRSNELKNMKNIIIYDVPGFDSPTVIHEAQTIEKIKNADAILLVTDVSKPDINAPQLNLLTKESDIDGIRLNQKLFIFGNMLDRVNKGSEAKQNMQTLREDVKKRGLALEKRVFFGSAYAYLQHLNKIEPNDSIDKLEKFELKDHITEPEKIKKELELYNESERFALLKQKINKNMEELNGIINSVVDKYSDTQAYEDRAGMFYLDMNSKLTDVIDRDLQGLNSELQTNLPEMRQTFTERLKAAVDKGLAVIDEKKIEEVRKQVDKTISTGFPVITVDVEVRQQLYSAYLEKFKSVIAGITDQEAEKINSSIMEIFEKGLELGQGCDDLDTVKKELKDLINNIISSIAYDRKIISPLIERFSRSLFDIIISTPFSAPDRLNKFMDVKKDIYSLATYHAGYAPGKPLFAQSLVLMIMAHKRSLSLADIKKMILEKIKGIPKISENFEKDEKLKTEIAERIYKGNIDTEKFFSEIHGCLSNVVVENPSNYRPAVVKKIKNLLDECEIRIEEMAEVEFIRSFRKNLKQADTAKELLEEINGDINVLIEILKDAVIEAISIETPFISIMNKQIQSIRNAIKDKRFHEFISRNSKKIKHFEFSKKEHERSQFENRRKIVMEMQKIQKTWREK